ncbi:hypothetical protein B0A55_05878 [Friedmanniomyces simplex]|uniref:ASST-domain-containing protein n=1 Tax=Friedmanniomyces simplex TaxID=329884 RepID=A0A4U0XK78_9PEZI|nr:hypothetical protein B0A55_05878 [Friedmanniomyces simplex]
MITDSEGQLIWQGPSGTASDMRVQSINGTKYMTYWQGNSSAAFGNAYGAVHILDNTYTEVNTICLDDVYFQTTNNFTYPCNVDMHEHEVTDHGSIVATAYNVTRHDLNSVGGPLEGWILESQFYDVDLATGKILFGWKSLDHLDTMPLNQSQEPLSLYGHPTGLTQSLPWEYFHVNSFQPVSDGYILNARHYWKVIKIKNDGCVDWQLQGFNNHSDFNILDDDAHFKWEHHVRATNITEDSMVISMHNNFNSEVNNGTGPTTGLELAVDTANRTVTLLKRLIKEYDQYGKAVCTARFGYDSTVTSYRAFSVEGWEGKPATEPKVAIESKAKGTAVYASWNGATDYDGWVAYAGSLWSDFSMQKMVARQGFETEIQLQGNFRERGRCYLTVAPWSRE